MSEDIKAPGTSEISDLFSIGVGIGDELQLQEMKLPNYRYAVNLIGFMNKVAVVVSHPVLHGEKIQIQEGEDFLVRGFSGRKMYQFKAKITGQNLQPFAHLFLSFPPEVDVINMRSALRIRPNLSCFVESQSNLLKVPATIEDISTSGSRVQAKVALGRIGESVVVNFRLPVDGEEHLFVLPATIRNLTEEKLGEANEKVFLHGLEFQIPAGKARMILQSFIYRTMAEAA